MLELKGNKILLREFTKRNLKDPRYHAWLRDLDVVKTIGRLEYLLPIEFNEIKDYVDNLLHSKNDYFFAIYYKENNEFIGTQRIGHIDWRLRTADIGIMIGNKDYWGKGIAKDAVSIACKYAFKVLGLRKLTGGTAVSNPAMCKCFERLGFKLEGRLRKKLLIEGKYVDHMLYGVFKKEFKPLK